MRINEHAVRTSHLGVTLLSHILATQHSKKASPHKLFVYGLFTQRSQTEVSVAFAGHMPGPCRNVQLLRLLSCEKGQWLEKWRYFHTVVKTATRIKFITKQTHNDQNGRNCDCALGNKVSIVDNLDTYLT